MPSALDFEPFLAELRQAVKTAWPEVSAVWDAEHANQIDWGGPELALPYAVILIPNAPRSTDGPFDALTYDLLPQVFYVQNTDGKSTAFRAKLTALVNYLRNNGLTDSSLNNVGDLQWGDELPVNQLLAMRDSAQRAGAVTLKCRVEEDLG